MTTEAPTVQLLDPEAIQVNPDNARRKLRGIPELAQSIREVGVIVPAIARSLDGNGTLQMIAGHRRRAACIEVGTRLPTIVISGEADITQVEAVLALTENEARDGLDTAERVRAFQTALDVGATEATVLAATGIKAPELTQISQVAKSKAATAMVEKFDLTLEQAAVLAEFGDDKDAVKRLTQVAVEKPGRWEWVLRGEREDRKERKALAEKLQPYIDAKVRVLTPTDLEQTSTEWTSRPHSRRPIATMLTDKGKNLTPAGHKNCPGRSVGIFRYWGYKDREVIEFCEDPTAHGHTPRAGATPIGRGGKAGPEPTDAEREAAAAERRKVRDNNKAMERANELRRGYVSALLKAVKVPKGTERFVTTFLLTESMPSPYETDGTLRELTKDGGAPALLKLPEPRVILGAVGVIGAVAERRTDKTSWRHPQSYLVKWLRYLESTGYALSEVEAEACASAEATAAKYAEATEADK